MEQNAIQQSSVITTTTDSEDSNGSRYPAQPVRSINLPFGFGSTNTKSVVYWTQVAITGTIIAIGTSFAATGIVPINAFMPLISGVVFYWMPSPSLN